MSKEIPLTQGKVAVVDDADFEFLSQWKWRAVIRHGIWYAYRNSLADSKGKRTTIQMHREILNPLANRETDHKDGNGLNNQRNNLRVATTSQNAQNRAKGKQGTSQFKGVSWHQCKKKWRADIQVRGKHIFLGRFTFEILAAKTYDMAAIKYFGEFARTNFLSRPAPD